jgi:D-alanyl-D-alanine carboxypeptidase/D-alanyl-D-alanine-endopeptidase (penicillin-binding protein 4)
MALFVGVAPLGGLAAAAQDVSSFRPVLRPVAEQASRPAQALQDLTHLQMVSVRPTARPDGFHKRALRGGADLVERSKVSGVVSYAVADLSGEVLEVYAPLQRLPPASVTKVVTAIYALETLGLEFNFVTDVFATGPTKAGIIQGDLILAGQGDPTLDTDDLHALAQALQGAGVTGISGQFYVYDRALPRVEMIDHEQTEYASYNPSITGLNVNYNRVHFEWRKLGADYSLKMDARTENQAPLVHVARMKIAERGLPVFDHSSGGTGAATQDYWTVSRGALGNGGSRWLPVRVPSLYAGELFVTLAKGLGLHLPAAQRLDVLQPEVTLLARHESAPLENITRDMLKYSTNLTAEVLGLTASRARGVEANDLITSAADMTAWAKERLLARHMNFVDHSGLGAASVVSASDMVRALSAPRVEPLLTPLLKPIVVLDEDRNVMRDTKISIAAKTGTLDFVSALSGYITAPDGRRMAFATLAGDVPKRTAAKAAGEAVPQGARTFNMRAKKLQQVLIQRWAGFYGT